MTDGKISPDQAAASSLLARQPWLVFVLPFAVYMLLGQLEPSPASPEKAATAAQDSQQADTEGASGFAAKYGYPAAYTMKLVLSGLALAFVFPVYRAFPFRLHRLTIPVGILGGLLWVGVCRLKLESRLWTLLGLDRLASWLGMESWNETTVRPMFDPLTTFSENAILLGAFLVVRFAGLVLLVPIIEEFFLRGFLLRLFGKTDWIKVPIGALSGAGFAVLMLYAAGTHPSELIASMLWFGMIGLLVMHTGNIWDAVVAHMGSNLVLGVYILAWQDWSLW